MNAPPCGQTAKRPDHLEIVVDLVDPADRRCPPDRMREKESPTVGVVTGAKRDAGKPCDDSRFDRILKENGAIKPVLAELCGETPFPSDTGVAAWFLKEDDLIHIR